MGLVLMSDRENARRKQTHAGNPRERPARRKLVEFDAETWTALDLLRRDSFKTFQELADEAFADLLKKHDRPTDLKTALRRSARGLAAGEHAQPRSKHRG
jgi:hypothetical protein